MITSLYHTNGKLRALGKFKGLWGNGEVTRWDKEGNKVSSGKEVNGELVSGINFYYPVLLSSWHRTIYCEAKGGFKNGFLHGRECELKHLDKIWFSGKFFEGVPKPGESLFWAWQSSGEYSTLKISKCLPKNGFFPAKDSTFQLLNYSNESVLIRSSDGVVKRDAYPVQLVVDDEGMEEDEENICISIQLAVEIKKSGVAGAAFSTTYRGSALYRVSVSFGSSLLKGDLHPNGTGVLYSTGGVPRIECLFSFGNIRDLKRVYDERGRLAMEFTDPFCNYQVFESRLDENFWPLWFTGNVAIYAGNYSYDSFFEGGKQSYANLKSACAHLSPVLIKLKTITRQKPDKEQQHEEISEALALQGGAEYSQPCDIITFENVQKKKIYWLLNQLSSDLLEGTSPHIVSSSTLIKLFKNSKTQPLHPITRAPLMRFTKIIFF